MKKQFVSTLLILCMLVVLLPLKAHAAASGSCGPNLTWTLDEDGTMTISGTGPMNDRFHEPKSKYADVGNGWTGINLGQTDPVFWADCGLNPTTVIIEPGVTTIGAGVFEGAGITSISIPSTVTEIRPRAFIACLFPSITIPNSVTRIGHDAFSYCALESVFIPGSVTDIEEQAFEGCQLLSHVEFSDGVVSIGDGAFRGCKNLSDIKIPDSVTDLGFWPFGQCFNLTHIELPDSLTILRAYAFQQCRSLTDIIIPEGIIKIDEGAFDSAGSLATVTIPKTVTSIANCAFRQCDALSDVYYDGSKEQWDLIEIGRDNESLKNATIHFSNQSTSSAPISTPTPSKPDIPNPEVHEEPHGYQFTDVSMTSPFAEAIDWAVSHGVTTGKTPTTFAPNEQCTHAQVITFLWRGYGEPEPSIGNPFTNVSVNQYYYKAALWAYENSMISGNTFDADKPCDRSSAVTYMWKAACAPEPDGDSFNFTDVSSDASYAQAVAWAVEREITSGTTPTTFSPDTICTRGQIVTFIYRGL